MQTWNAEVVQYHRLRNDLAVVRLVGYAVPFSPGQSVEVVVPQNPRVSRRYSPALPPSLDGKLEFHVRAVPAGWVSGSIVNDTRPGDVWQLSDPGGALHVDDSGRDVVMIAGGTGLAPMRSLILDLSQRPSPPNVTLYVGGRSPRDLYASDLLWILVSQLPWLTVVPVVDQLDDPWGPDRFNDAIRAEVGSAAAFFGPEHCWEGSLADVIGVQEPFTNHQVLVCGSPGMEAATVSALLENGTPEEAILR
ncbi:oxidoreductase [Rhodococcus sp. BP-252]|uniref:FAD-binding oxidoreductase n=1 Tax=unclassified Rhodococcus (in: high G+C Gram-positive bacteria) TaxID=192944 RepID=UPI00142FE5E4|nr:MULTISPECIES: FAD-binding oxidoreductase [unclassified Rhodococcus (in: high G+C Gram-positive bacteria)]MBY6414702.1 oxidoreductase [Rhodococcus sp. BP-320]MBY6419606.1 oxidoreductase [Rhodococcus sp. BP-321]MBY6424560.1 oxidoreductase [Rhodococcus sp. BP-324]MBY6429557.1 oxidoreductase [Rhodococcus sp. BP-323]MBY6434529.1 oxidoreductase [Rhodococcus sp. BP-322]